MLHTPRCCLHQRNEELAIKFVSAKKQFRLDRLSAERFSRRLRRTQAHITGADAVRPNRMSYERLWIAPEVFSIGLKVNRRPMLQALANLRTMLLKRPSRVMLDFSRTRQMHAEGTLLFTAELRTLIHLQRGITTFDVTPSKVDKVMQVLKQIGVLDVLGLRFHDVVCRDDDVVHWLHASGQGAQGELYDEVMGPYDGRIPEALSQKLYSGVSEAMTNVVNHAYTRPRQDGLRTSSDRDWWMFSTEREGRLVVVICDLGAGIPGTLPYSQDHRSLWKRLRRSGSTDDGTIIAHAVSESVTRTEQHHRGRGLGQIARVIQSIDNATVSISSNRGFYSRGSTGEVKLGNYQDSIQGTLIRWEFPIQQGTSS